MHRPCLNSGCPELVESGRCARHSKQADAQRGSSTERGYGSDWEVVRLVVLRRDLYTCKIQTHCRGARATEVDHIRPIGEYPEGRLLMSNLQAACKSCNAAKGARFELKEKK